MERFEQEPVLEKQETVAFEYSPEAEAERVRYTFNKFPWYQEQGYRVRMPKKILEKAEAGESVTDEEILEAVNEEFEDNHYRHAADARAEGWNQVGEMFLEKLATLCGPMPGNYEVQLTQYGTSGSYRLPNFINLRTEEKKVPPWFTLAHEMVHLEIEPWIKEYEIPHWKKERLVDLTMNKFFPEYPRTQRESEKHEEVQAAFDKHFPDMHAVIREVAEALKKESAQQ